MPQINKSRRRFLTRSAAAVSTLAIGAGLVNFAYAETAAGRKAQMANYRPVFFSQREWRCLTAACDTLIPSDQYGPGALDALAPIYIDKQMQTEYATGGLWYMQGPFFTNSAAAFGYQYKFVPRDIYRLGLADLAAHCGRTHEKDFDEIGADQKIEILKGLESGSIELPNIPSDIFFRQLLSNTREGFLADPIYGGNQNMVGWKMLGFPGARGDYRQFVTRHNEPFPHNPISIEQQEA